MSLELILSRLDSVRQSGQDRYFARCPVHDERRASLLITPKSDGKITMYCFGCGAKGPDVVAAIGLAPSVLFPEQLERRGRHGAEKHQNAPRAPAKPRRRYIDATGDRLLWLTALEWDLTPELADIMYPYRQQELYDRYGPTLKPQPRLRYPPAWAVAARRSSEAKI